MSELIKSKERSNTHGEVFTPSWLVNEMLDKLPENQWTNSAKTFIDPACGNGNFLVEVVRRKIEAGSHPYLALKATYGIDIMPDNIEECRDRLVAIAYKSSNEVPTEHMHKFLRFAVEQNIRLGDALKFEVDDIFSTKPSAELRAFRAEQNSPDILLTI
jgi:SAM-dependent methyltransferase